MLQYIFIHSHILHIYTIGAEKALFRALKTKGNTPKYGLIYHSSFIGRAASKNKGMLYVCMIATYMLACLYIILMYVYMYECIFVHNIV